MISDTSAKGMPHNLNRAVKIMGESGWRVAAFAKDSSTPVTPIWVIMEQSTR